jgi:hypothetical protein
VRHSAKPLRNISRMRRRLLMPHQHMLNLILLKNGVVQRQHRPARIAKNGIHPMLGQRPQHNMGATDKIGHNKLS